VYKAAFSTALTTNFAAAAESTRWARCGLTTYAGLATALTSAAPTMLAAMFVADNATRWTTALGSATLIYFTATIVANLIWTAASVFGAHLSLPTALSPADYSTPRATTTANIVCVANIRTFKETLSPALLVRAVAMR
jgi:hypothetical protein